MQFSTTAVATTLLAVASAQKVHVVSVSNQDNALKFYPENMKAEVGDMIQFQFLAGKHSVVQSNFDNPCVPIQKFDKTQKGMFSGYMDVAASASSGDIPIYTMEVKSDKPLWLYCSQGKHCQAGMVMVVNENTSANSSRSFDAFKEISAKAPENLDPMKIGASPTGISGGTSSSIPSPTGSDSPSATGTGAPEQAAGSAVSTSAWAGLLSIVAAVALF
ncbi:hypothetical protein F4808DRAFT_244051 [Astrocystis sublimbata]|nr:hypothetical protein F4808DRAFT_244051 [Astrocystis sublimbata]